jgi:hypothetical protein
MHPPLSPSENARRYIFSDEDCLYRDHFARRVVADIEGSGFAWVEKANCPLLAIRDEEEADGFQWSYTTSLTVVALEPGEVSIASYHPAAPAQLEAGIDVGLPYTGSGWLLSATGSVIVDDRHERGPLPSREFPLPFFSRLEGEGGANIVPSSARTELIDAFEIGDSAAVLARRFSAQNMSKLVELDSCFRDGTQRRAMVASHLNRASWHMDVPETAQGLRLRRIYDRFHGRQRARVFIDGDYVGYWYEPEQDRKCRWHVSDFGVPESFVAGKRSIEIAIDPPPGTPLWSISRMEAYAVTHG